MARQIYIKRDIEAVLRKQTNHFPAIALCGPRQSGKSTLLKHLFAKSHALFSFDDPLTREQALSDPKLFLEQAGERIIFDEIQYVPQLLSYIKILIDKQRTRRGRFIITGSQQFNLIKNLGDTLAGRVALFDLLPFSAVEKRAVRQLTSKLKDTQGSFIHSCLRGSFPEACTHPEIEIDTWYGSYIQTYLERDVRTLFNVESLREFQQFLRLLAARCSQVLNLSAFAGEIGVNVSTIKRWLSILQAGEIIYILGPYYRNLGKRITKSPKIYFLDAGLVCYLTGQRTSQQILTGTMSGALFECFIVQETVKYFYNRGRRPNLFYLRTHNNLEVDLILEEGLRIYPFEIKLSRSPLLRMAEPIERFRKLFSRLDIKEGAVISLSGAGGNLTRNVDALDLYAYLQALERTRGRSPRGHPDAL